MTDPGKKTREIAAIRSCNSLTRLHAYLALVQCATVVRPLMSMHVRWCVV